jgi:hypothetical protein
MNVLKALVSTVFAPILTPAPTHSDSVTYELALTPIAGSLYGGTGSLTIESVPSATGISDYTVSDENLLDLVFEIGGQTFKLANASGNVMVRFSNGELNDITFAATTGTTPNRFTLHSTNGYVFYYNDGQSASYGTFSASPATSASSVTSASPVPEPGSSLTLLAIGLITSAGTLFRRLSIARALTDLS